MKKPSFLKILLRSLEWETVLIAFASSIVFAWLASRSGRSASEDGDTIEIILVIAILSAAILIYLIRFLNTDKERKNRFEDRFTARSKEKIEKDEIRKKILQVFTDNPDMLNVEDAVYNKVVNKLEESLISKLDNRFKKSIEN
jgi:hypothetical protein